MFLQAVTVLMGIGALAFLLWEPHLEGRNAHATPFEIYFEDPFLAYVYFGSIPFFVGLYQAIKVLGYAGQDKVFSQAAVTAVRTMKHCAFITAGAIVAASFASGALDAVWSTAARTLTSYGSLVSDIATAVWGAGTRTLTSFGTLAADAATAVWAAGTRTLSSYGSLVADVATAVWGAVTRTLTATSAPSDMAKESTLTAIKGAGWSASTDTLEAIRDAIPSAAPTVSDIRTELEGVGTYLTAIKAKTDNLPTDPAGVSDLPSEPPSAADIAGAVLDEPLGAHTGLIATNLDAKVSEVEASVDLTPVTDMLDEIKGATWSETTDTLEEISDAIADISPAGGDAIAFEYTVTRSGAPVEGAFVRFCSDSGYANAAKTGYTNALGMVTMNVPAGTYYITVDAPRQARAYDTEVVS